MFTTVEKAATKLESFAQVRTEQTEHLQIYITVQPIIKTLMGKRKYRVECSVCQECFEAEYIIKRFIC